MDNHGLVLPQMAMTYINIDHDRSELNYIDTSSPELKSHLYVVLATSSKFFDRKWR